MTEGDAGERHVDLRKLMAEIRDRAVNPAGEIPDVDSPQPEPLRDEYHAADFVALGDEEFVRKVYERIFRREPDAASFEYFLDQLRRGETSKAQLLGRLARSEEGRLSPVRIRGLLAEDPPANTPATQLEFAVPDMPLVDPRESWSVHELTAFDDAAFVMNAYRAVVRRDPDAQGLDDALTALREGRVEKVELLGGIRRSPEGRAAGVRIRGLWPRYWALRLRALPVFGSLAALIHVVADLPRLRRRVSRLEGALVTQRGDVAHVVAGARERLAGLEGRIERLAGGIEEELVWLAQQGGQRRMVAEALARRDSQLAAMRAALLLQQQEAMERYAETRGAVDRVEAQQSAMREDIMKSLQDELRRVEAVERELSSSWLELSRKHAASMEALAWQVQSARELAQARIEELGQKVATALHTAGDDAADWDQLYVALEDRFRGKADEIARRLVAYVPHIHEVHAGTVRHPVLDVGCGRGEWLKILRNDGLAGRGIDFNRTMVERCRSEGLAVEAGDALAYLDAAAAGTFGAITAFHVIEHLTSAQLLRLLRGSARALMPGGIVILETPNPENVVVGACNFYVDPTHNRPLPPELMAFLLEQTGFEDVRIVRMGEVPAGLPVPFPEGHPKAPYNPFIHALRHNFFSPPDYAVIGVKPRGA